MSAGRNHGDVPFRPSPWHHWRGVHGDPHGHRGQLTYSTVVRWGEGARSTVIRDTTSRILRGATGKIMQPLLVVLDLDEPAARDAPVRSSRHRGTVVA